jgi:hypothetical protein
MAGNGLRTSIFGALIMIGFLAPVGAAPIAPTGISALLGSHIEPVSFWGLPFPYGYTYRPGQCYKYIEIETPRGLRWQRIWICTERRAVGYGEGGRF